MGEENVPSAGVPIQEGIFVEEAPGRHRLVASRCRACGRFFFPRRRYCAACGRPTLEDVRFAPRGTVATFTCITRKSRYTVVEPPYVEAEVDLPEGISVFTVLGDCAFEEVSVGMAVEVYVEPVTKNAAGADVLAYKFRPVR